LEATGAASPLPAQAASFAFLFLTGCVAGIGVDLHRGLLGALRPRRPWRDLADGLCAASAGALLAAGMLAATWGELRLYALLAIAAGLSAYFALASPLLLPATVRSVAVGRRVVRRVARAATRVGAGAARRATRAVHRVRAALRGAFALRRSPPPAPPPRQERQRRGRRRGGGRRAA
jgi:hypothetical protein